MLFRVTLLGGVLCFAAAGFFQDQAAERTKLAGKWQPADGAKSDCGTWTLEDNNGSIRVTQESNGQKIAEYECNTMGQECKIKEAGHAAKVSVWFNGSKLVEMRTHGSEVVKRRFHVTGDGDALELEVIQIAPVAKSELVHLTRLHTETAGKAQ